MKNFLGRGGVIKDRRAASRRGYNEDAWFRAEQSLLRECRVLDLSRTGVASPSQTLRQCRINLLCSFRGAPQDFRQS